METKNNILNNFLDLATEYQIDDTHDSVYKCPPQYYIISGATFTIWDQIDMMGYVLDDLYDKNEVSNILISKLYKSNRQKDLDSVNALKNELRERIEVKLNKKDIQDLLLTKLNGIIDIVNRKKGEYQNKVYVDHIINLLDKSLTLFTDSKYAELENCLKILHSYMGYVNVLKYSRADIENIMLLNRLIFPNLYYQDLN